MDSIGEKRPDCISLRSQKAVSMAFFRFQKFIKNATTIARMPSTFSSFMPAKNHQLLVQQLLGVLVHIHKPGFILQTDVSDTDLATQALKPGAASSVFHLKIFKNLAEPARPTS